MKSRIVVIIVIKPPRIARCSGTMPGMSVQHMVDGKSSHTTTKSASRNISPKSSTLHDTCFCFWRPLCITPPTQMPNLRQWANMSHCDEQLHKPHPLLSPASGNYALMSLEDKAAAKLTTFSHCFKLWKFPHTLSATRSAITMWLILIGTNSNDLKGDDFRLSRQSRNTLDYSEWSTKWTKNQNGLASTCNYVQWVHFGTERLAKQALSATSFMRFPLQEPPSLRFADSSTPFYLISAPNLFAIVICSQPCRLCNSVFLFSVLDLDCSDLLCKFSLRSPQCLRWRPVSAAPRPSSERTRLPHQFGSPTLRRYIRKSFSPVSWAVNEQFFRIESN